MPYKQSDFDSLCGVFAVINAIDCFFPLSHSEAKDLFQYIVADIDVSDFIVEGTVLPELKDIIKLAIEWFEVNAHPPIEYKLPFLKKKFDNPEDWLKHLELQVKPEHGVIIGVEEPSMHWTVVKKITPKYLKLADSGCWDKFRRRAIYIHSDRVPSEYEDHLLIAQHQVIVIRFRGSVAQRNERFRDMEEAVGSNPT